MPKPTFSLLHKHTNKFATLVMATFPSCQKQTITFIILTLKLDVFEKHGYPQQQQSQNTAKILHFDPTPPYPKGHAVKCEQSIDELTVQVWLLYHHPNVRYCTLCVNGMELRTDRRMDGQTDDPITRCSQWTFQAGGIKTIELYKMKL